MKQIIFSFLIALLLYAPSIYGQPCDSKTVALSGGVPCNTSDFLLVFSDEFDGNNVNTSKWAHHYPWGKNNQQEFYTTGNRLVGSGTLKLVVRDDTTVTDRSVWFDDSTKMIGCPNCCLQNFRNWNITSGMIYSKKTFSYGKFEIRCKLPKGKGFAPAFWTFGGSHWNEIDIFEFVTQRDFWGNVDLDLSVKKQGTDAHHEDLNNNVAHGSCGASFVGADYSADFHTFSVIWDADKIRWFVDGVAIRTMPQYYNINGTPVFCNSLGSGTFLHNNAWVHQPMNIIANLMVECGDNAPDGNTPFPSSFEIDYIRYYVRPECPNLVITQTSQLNIKSEQFNVITGNSIIVDGGILVDSLDQLDMVASTFIRLKQGFHAKSKDFFLARLKANLCATGSEKQGTTEINESSLKLAENDVSVMPNPSTGIFKLNYNGPVGDMAKIIVKDITGKTIVTSPLKSSMDIDLRNCASNVYFLNVMNGKESKILKLVKID